MVRNGAKCMWRSISIVFRWMAKGGVSLAKYIWYDVTCECSSKNVSIEKKKKEGRRGENMPLYSFVKEYAGTKSKSASSVNLFRNIVLKPKYVISCMPLKEIPNYICCTARRTMYLLWVCLTQKSYIVRTLGFVYQDTDTWQRIQWKSLMAPKVNSTKNRVILYPFIAIQRKAKFCFATYPQILLSHVIKQWVNQMCEVLTAWFFSNWADDAWCIQLGTLDSHVCNDQHS